MLKRVVGQLANYAPSKMIPAVTGFITIPIVTSLFAPEEYGRYVLALSLARLLYAGGCSGIGSAGIRFYSEYKKRGEESKFFVAYISDIGIAVSIMCCCAFAILHALGASISSELKGLVKVALIYFVLDAIYVTLVSVLRAKESSRLYTVFTLIYRYTSLASGLSLVVFVGMGVSGLIWGHIVVLPFLSIILFYILTKEMKITGAESFKEVMVEMLKYGLPLGIGNMAMWSLSLSDRYVIAAYLPESAVGLYSIGYKISDTSISILVSLFMLSMGPFVINSWVTSGKLGAQKAIRAVTRAMVVLCTPMCVGLAIVSVPVVRVLAAEAYLDGHRIVGYVAFSGLFLGLCQVSQTVLVIGKRTGLLAISQILAGVVNVVSNLVLVPRFGYVAAGVTTLLSYVLLFFLQTFASMRVFRWEFPFRSVFNVFVGCAFLGPAAYILVGLSGGSTLDDIVCVSGAAVIGGTLYFLAILLLGEFKEDLQIVRREGSRWRLAVVWKER